MNYIHTTLIFILCLTVFIPTKAQDNASSEWTELRVSHEESFMEANTMILIGRYDEALKILKKLYKENNSNPGLNFELAKVYGSLNDLPSAIKHAKKAVALNLNNEYYHLILANLLIESNQNAQATEVLSNLIALKPNHTEYYDMLARAYLRLGEYEEALRTFDKLENQLGFSEDLAVRRIDILNEYGKSKEVISIMDRLIELYPHITRHRHNLANYYVKQGKSKKAKEVYRSILEIDPDDPQANLAMIDDIDNPADDTGYLHALQPLIENDKLPLDKKIMEMVPYLERLGAEPDLGEPLLKIGKTLIQLHPEEAKVHAMYGDIFNGLSQLDKAIEQYEKTIALDDRVYTVWEQLILAYDRTANYKAMATKAEEAIDLFPNKSSAYYLHASALISLDRLDEVEEYLNEAFLIAGKDLYHKAHAVNQMARLAMKRNDLDKAADLLAQSTEWSLGQDPESIELLGDLSAMTGNTKEAAKFWKKAKELGSLKPGLDQKIKTGNL